MFQCKVCGAETTCFNHCGEGDIRWVAKLKVCSKKTSATEEKELNKEVKQND